MFSLARYVVSTKVWLENHVSSGGVPLLLIPMIWLLLPESIDYLVRRKKTEKSTPSS